VILSSLQSLKHVLELEQGITYGTDTQPNNESQTAGKEDFSTTDKVHDALKSPSC